MGLGDWIKDNKQGVLGGLETAAGIGLMAFSGPNPLSTGLITGGVSQIAGEIAHDRADAAQAEQQELYKQQLEQQRANQEYQLRRQQVISQNSINARGYTNTGTVFALGGEMLNPYTKSNNPLLQYKGPKHEQGGIQLLNGAEVEGGETSINGYVFSDRLKPKGSKKTFAQISKDIEKRFSLRPNDKTDKIAKQRALEDLAMQQEEFKKIKGIDNSGNKFGGGGQTPPWYDANKATNYYSLEDFNKAGFTDTYTDANGVMYGRGGRGKIGVYKPYSGEYGNFTEDQALQIMLNEYNSGKTVRRGWNKNVLDKFDAITGGESQGILRPTMNLLTPKTATIKTEATKLEHNITPSDFTPSPTGDALKKILKNKSAVPFTTSTDDGIGDIGKGIISGLPDVLAGVGTALLSRKVDYPELDFKPTANLANTYQINPALVDPRDQIRQVGINFGATNEAIRQTASGSGNYMSNRIASGIAQSEANSKVYNAINGINSEILNKTRQFNASQAQQGSQFNATQLDKAENLQFKTDYYNNALKQQEISDKLGMQMDAINLVANGINTGVRTYLNEKEFNTMMEMTGGDNYKYSRIGNKWYRTFEGQGYKYIKTNNGISFLDQNGKPITEEKAKQLAAAYKKNHS